MKIKAPQLQNLISSLKKSGAIFSKESADILGVFSRRLYKDIRYRSPVGFTEEYKLGWDIENPKPGKYRIYNSAAEDYRGFMETGSKPGAKPWPTAGPNTVAKDGRIWSSQRPEPVAGGAVESANWDQLYKDLLNSMVKVI